MGDMVADGSDVASGLLWFTFQQLARLLVNLLVAFRELLNAGDTPLISKSPRR